MAQAMTDEMRAIGIATSIAGDGCEVTHDRSDSNRFEFSYSGGCIQSHKIPDGWEVSGFGKRWFALRQE